MQKLCTKCKSEKEPSEFNKDASRKDGLHPYCRDCQHVQRQRYRANPEVKARESAYFKAYYADQKNKEKHAARMADYFKRNRGAYAVRGDKWRAKPENVAKILAYRRKPESIAVNKARQIAWRKENPEAVKAKDQRRAARKRGASGFHTGHDIKQVVCLAAREVRLLPYQHQERLSRRSHHAIGARRIERQDQPATALQDLQFAEVGKAPCRFHA